MWKEEEEEGAAGAGTLPGEARRDVCVGFVKLSKQTSTVEQQSERASEDGRVGSRSHAETVQGEITSMSTNVVPSDNVQGS